MELDNTIFSNPLMFIDCKSCFVTYHDKCIQKLKLGELITEDHLRCPNCFSATDYEHSEYFIRQEDLNNFIKEIDNGKIFILCSICETPKEICPGEIVDQKYKLICSDCTPISIKSCPNCSVPTINIQEKGCIKCENCTKTWCWICQVSISKLDVGKHSNNHHFSQMDKIYEEYLTNCKYAYVDKIPPRFLTKELVDVMIKRRPVNELSFIKKKTPEICKKFLDIDPNGLRFITHEQTEEMCMEVVKRDGLCLRFVIKKTFALNLAAVKQDGRAIQYVRRQIPILCEEAIKSSRYAIKYIDRPSVELCMKSIEYNYTSLANIEKQTDELCWFALLIDPKAIAFVKNQKEEMCISVLRKEWRLLRVIKNQTRKVCLAAIKNNPDAAQYVWDKRLIR